MNPTHVCSSPRSWPARQDKPVVYRNLPEAEYASALAGAGLPQSIAQAIASWDACAARGALFDDSRQLSRLIGRDDSAGYR